MTVRNERDAGHASGDSPTSFPTHHGYAASALPHSSTPGGSMSDSAVATQAETPPRKRDRSHWLYIAVILAVLAGILVGFVWPSFGVALRPLGTGFVNLVRMLISPIIFCTIVLGVGSIRKAATVGKVGGLALAYFLVMSTIALIIGLLVGNLLEPGAGLHLSEAQAQAGAAQAQAAEAASTTEFLLTIIPTTLFSALTSGEAILRGVKHLERLVFRVMSMIMWLAPIGAFGAIAAVVGATGWKALVALGQVMLAFYITCLLFVIVLLGLLLRATTGVGIFQLLNYLKREFLLIVSTSSSEVALPRLIAKMEHLGVSRSVVGITVPTGYSFNLDGTAIYLTMASIFIADALDKPLSISEQISLLVFMIIASKGAAGVTGAGLAVLAGGLQTHRPDLVDGVGLVVGIDRFMSEARALTNFAGNAVATVIIGKWVGEFDQAQATRVFHNEEPFDETTMLDDIEPPAPPSSEAALA